MSESTTPTASSPPPAPSAPTSDAPANQNLSQFAQFLKSKPAPQASAPAAPIETTQAPPADPAPPEPAPDAPPAEPPVPPEAPPTSPTDEGGESALSKSISFSPEQQAILDKRIGKVVAQRSAAERERDALRQQLEQVRAQTAQTPPNQQQPPERPVAPNPNAPLAEVSTVAGLQKLHADAKEAVRWAETQLDREDIGNGVQVGEQVLTRQDLKAIVRNAKVTLEDHIPQRYNFLQAQHQATQQAFELYPELKDQNSQEYLAAQQAYRDNPWLNGLPNSALIVGRMIQGVKLEQQRIAAKKVPAQPPTPAVRPRPSGDQAAVSATGSDLRTPGSTRATQQLKQIEAKLTAKNGVGQKDYAAFLSQSEQLRSQS